MNKNTNQTWLENESLPTNSAPNEFAPETNDIMQSAGTSLEKSGCKGIGYAKNTTRTNEFDMFNQGKAWTREEDNWLKQNIKSISGTDCAKYLGRSLDSVYARCFKIGSPIREKRVHDNSIKAICIDCNEEKTISNFRFRAGRNYYEKRCKPCEDLFSIKNIPQKDKDVMIGLYSEGYNLHDIQNKTGFKNSNKISIVIKSAGIIRTNLIVLENRAITKYKNNKFGLLTPLERFEIFDEPSVYEWECLCECGKIKRVRQHTLHQGEAKSCGDMAHYRGANSKMWKGHGELPMAQFNRIQSGAKLREIEFSLTIEYAWSQFLLQEGKCRFTGESLSFEKDRETHGTGTASLDRIDSSKGYIEGNVQWVHKIINVAKQELSDTEYIDWCRKVAKHNENK